MMESPPPPPGKPAEPESAPGDSGDEINPFAPVAAISTPPPRAVSSRLTSDYWWVLGAAYVVLIGLSFVLPGFAVPGLIALVAATLRVPMVRRRIARRSPEKLLAPATRMLFISWALMLAVGFASFVAFFLICFPTGLALYNLNHDGAAWTAILFGISGACALAVYAWLFYLSLRLKI